MTLGPWATYIYIYIYGSVSLIPLPGLGPAPLVQTTGLRMVYEFAQPYEFDSPWEISTRHYHRSARNCVTRLFGIENDVPGSVPALMLGTASEG